MITETERQVRDYIKDNLQIKLEVRRDLSLIGTSSTLTVSVLMDDEVIAQDQVSIREASPLGFL